MTENKPYQKYVEKTLEKNTKEIVRLNINTAIMVKQHESMNKAIEKICDSINAMSDRFSTGLQKLEERLNAKIEKLDEKINKNFDAFDQRLDFLEKERIKDVSKSKTRNKLIEFFIKYWWIFILTIFFFVANNQHVINLIKNL